MHKTDVYACLKSASVCVYDRDHARVCYLRHWEDWKPQSELYPTSRCLEQTACRGVPGNAGEKVLRTLWSRWKKPRIKVTKPQKVTELQVFMKKTQRQEITTNAGGKDAELLLFTVPILDNILLNLVCHHLCVKSLHQWSNGLFNSVLSQFIWQTPTLSWSEMSHTDWKNHNDQFSLPLLLAQRHLLHRVYVYTWVCVCAHLLTGMIALQRIHYFSSNSWWV